jgi:DNA-binding transcriptional MerR regulator
MQMKNHPDELRGWSGGIEDLARKAWDILRNAETDDAGQPGIRLIRDYIQRGILGGIPRAGKELVFTYDHLVRFVAARVLLADGWSLGKIAEYLDQCRREELEALLPQPGNRALAALRQIRPDTGPTGLSLSSSAHLRKAATMFSVQREMGDALRRVGLPAEGPPVEAVTRIDIAPWFQVLVTTERLSRITPEEAEEVGRAITASLLRLARRKEFRK